MGIRDLPHTRLSVRSIGDERDFEQLAQAWNALAMRASASVFLRHEWFSAAWAWRRTDAKLNIMCVYSGEQLIGILPLVRLRHNHRSLKFLSVPDTQCCDLLADKETAGLVGHALADHIIAQSSSWDILRLERLPPGSIAAEALLPRLRGKARNCSLSATDCNLFVQLEGAWEDYYAARSRSLKKALNLASNRVSRAGPFEVVRVTSGCMDPAQVNKCMGEVIDISRRSWKQGTGNTLEAAGPRAFIQRLTDAAFPAGWLSIWLLRIHGRAVAMEYQLVHNDQVYALRSDFDDEYRHLSTGSFLNKCMMQALFAAGFKRYFLGPGTNPYKTRWSDSGDLLYSFVAYAPTLRGRATALWPEKLKPKLRSLKERLASF